MKARLYLDVEFDEKRTDADSIAAALDRLLKTALSTPGIMDEYGGEPRASEFLVLDTGRAAELADEIDSLIDGREDDELGKSLVPVRDFLRHVALGGQDV